MQRQIEAILNKDLPPANYPQAEALTIPQLGWAIEILMLLGSDCKLSSRQAEQGTIVFALLMGTEHTRQAQTYTKAAGICGREFAGYIHKALKLQGGQRVFDGSAFLQGRVEAGSESGNIQVGELCTAVHVLLAQAQGRREDGAVLAAYRLLISARTIHEELMGENPPHIDFFLEAEYLIEEVRRRFITALRKLYNESKVKKSMPA